MFYEPAKRNHGLPHDPFKAIVAPRPIGWITTMSAKGEINLAPYSYFNGVSSHPPVVMFSSEGFKDSVTNARETKEFVCNLATWELREQMNATSESFPHAPSKLVKPPRVAASPCSMECKVTQIVPLQYLGSEKRETFIVFGQVIGVHVDEKFIDKNGLLDSAAMKSLARCGYQDYAVLDETFTMTRPK